MSPRRTALVTLAVIALALGYVIGAARSSGTLAAASARTINTSSPQISSAQSSSTQTGAISPAGGTGITVGGRADVAGTPDTLRLDLSVVANAPSVSEALAKANGSADAVQKSLLGNRVAKRDLQTSGLTISPDYDYPNNGTPRLRGYQVSESVSARLRDLGRAGDTIGRAVGAGGNAVRVNGISLDLEDTGVLVSRARDKAFADAKAKAGQYAKAAGRSLGDVVSIAETVANPSPISMPYAAADSSAGQLAKVPVQPGSQDVSVAVTVVFAMG